jgi:hypothetical protein
LTLQQCVMLIFCQMRMAILDQEVLLAIGSWFNLILLIF